MSALDASVLVLNRSWIAVHVASLRRALSLVYQGLAHIVSTDDFGTYDFDSWKEISREAVRDYVRAVNFKFKRPEVIRLRYFSGMQRRKVRFSRRNIFRRDDFTCQYCGRQLPERELSLDHVVPRSRGGKSTWDNLVVACLKCNDRKASRLPREAGMTLLDRPEKPNWPGYLAARSAGARYVSWTRFIGTGRWRPELGA
jgi:5-methylcytosine-specific restriction endonuclease McrA